MTYLYLELINDETKTVIRRVYVSTKSAKQLQYLKTKWRSEKTDEFNSEHTVTPRQSDIKLPIVDDNLTELT